MDSTGAKPLKPSSNISDIVSKFAKACKLRSIGVHQPHSSNNDRSGEDGSSDVTEDTECGGVKIHPQPVEVKGENKVCGGDELSKLFDIVSTLKLAYVQLQEAHLPYNPKKIIAADERFMADLEAICNMKRTCKEKQFVKRKSESARTDILSKKIELNEKLIEEFKLQMEVNNSEIICLQKELRDLNLVNSTLADKARQISLQKKTTRVWTIKRFQDTCGAASKSIHDFAKPLISLMKAAGWNLDLAAKAVEEEAIYMKRSHKKYAFEAYISRRMFSGVTLKAYNPDDIMRYDDPIDALIENPHSDFARYCGQKYIQVVHPIMEAQFFGNLDHRTLVISGRHPRTSFYQIFARMARWIWVLRSIAPMIDSKAKIFVVKRGSDLSRGYMESVIENHEDATVLEGGKVEFMVAPGFKILETVVKSRVYVSK